LRGGREWWVVEVENRGCEERDSGEKKVVEKDDDEEVTEGNRG
jgi:hypothetical protein